jgi:hypothetical protein
VLVVELRVVVVVERNHLGKGDHLELRVLVVELRVLVVERQQNLLNYLVNHQH